MLLVIYAALWVQSDGRRRCQNWGFFVGIDDWNFFGVGCWSQSRNRWSKVEL
jgi:hypothetical protein